MQLNEFIQKSLLQIFKGIKDAQVDISNQGVGVGVINPKWGTATDHSDYTSEIEFDIAISVTESKSGGGEAGLSVVSVKLGGTRNTEAKHGTVSRVAFRLPVAFPAVTVTDVPPKDRTK